MDDWKIDIYPLFDVSMEKSGQSIRFHWFTLPNIQELILYRVVSADPLQAQEIARSKDEKLVDSEASTTTGMNYWVIAVPKLERTADNSEIYKNKPVATAQLATNFPLRCEWRDILTIRRRNFPCQEQSVYA